MRLLQFARTEAGNEAGPHRRARVYLAAFVAGSILSVVCFYAALGTLRVLGHLPPPLSHR